MLRATLYKFLILTFLASPAFAGHFFVLNDLSDGDLSSWNEKAEGGIASNDTHAMLPDGGAGDNETGEGIGSGAELVWTQYGTIGASGTSNSYPYRTFDGDDDYLSGNSAIPRTVFNTGDNVWSVQIKFDPDDEKLANGDFLWVCYSGGNTEYFRVSFDSSGGTTRIEVFFRDTTMAANSQDAIPSGVSPGQVLYFAIWSNSGTSVRAAWNTSLITNWADIPTGQTIEISSASGWFSADNAFYESLIATNPGSTYTPMDFYFIIMSKENLITN